jgi:hypothetical protein
MAWVGSEMFQILSLFIYFMHQVAILKHNGEAICTSPSLHIISYITDRFWLNLVPVAYTKNYQANLVVMHCGLIHLSRRSNHTS